MEAAYGSANVGVLGPCLLMRGTNVPHMLIFKVVIRWAHGSSSYAHLPAHHGFGIALPLRFVVSSAAVL